MITNIPEKIKMESLEVLSILFVEEREAFHDLNISHDLENILKEIYQSISQE